MNNNQNKNVTSAMVSYLKKNPKYFIGKQSVVRWIDHFLIIHHYTLGKIKTFAKTYKFST